MKKIRFKSPLKILASLPIYITEIEFDQSNNDLFITFPIYDPDLSVMQKNASIVQQLVHDFNYRTTAKTINNCLYCRIPQTDLPALQEWLYKKTSKSDHEKITNAFSEGRESTQKIEQQSCTASIKPPKGKYSTEFVIGSFQNQRNDLHATATARKIANQSEYIFKEELLAELEAFHGELSRLLFSPLYAPKVRSVHNEKDGKPMGVVSKKVMEFCSLLDLFAVHGKVLDTDELLKIGIVRILVFSLAMEETDPNSKNYGIDRHLTQEKKIADGTHLTRLDPGLSSFSLINIAYKIYGLSRGYAAAPSHAFPRTVKPEDSFPIHFEDFLSLPNLHHATPSNWPFHPNRKSSMQTFKDEDKEKAATQNVDHLGCDENFYREKYQHLLKVALINAEMLESIGLTFISDSKILTKVHDEKFCSNLTPAYIDTLEFRENANKFGDEYRKAILKTLYVNHYIKRYAKWRETLLNMPEFREYLLKYEDRYLHAISCEFHEYNNQFAATKKTSNSDVYIVERNEGIKIQISYKKKYLHRLVDMEKINQDFATIRSQAEAMQNTLYKEFILALEKYIKSHAWEVGLQFKKKVILNDKGVEKAVPTCVYNQMEEIKKYHANNQSLQATVDKIMSLGEEAYDKRNSSSSSQDTSNYYNLFKGKNIEKVNQGIKPAVLDDTFVNIL